MPASVLKRNSKETPTRAIITLRRLKVALLASVVVPVFLFIAGACDERSQLLQAAGNEAMANVAVLREHVLKTIETDELLLREIDHSIQGRTWDNLRSSSAALSEDIGAMHAGMPQVSLMAVSDAEGLIQAATPPYRANEQISVAQQEFWTAQRDADRGTFFSRAYVGPAPGHPNFGISRRRTTPDGRFDGTVHVAVASSYFSNFWSKAIAGKEDAVIALVRTDGEVLARYPEMSRPRRLPAAGLHLLLGHLEADPQGGVYRVTSYLDGVDRLSAYARVGTFPLVVRCAFSVHAVLAPWRLHLLILGGCGAAAASAVIAALLALIVQLQKLVAEQARRAEIEEAARKGQPMELLGQLSAGTAHDLANILQVMQNSAAMISRHPREPERVRLFAGRLVEDAERGASLTHRMLDLVRRNQGKEAIGQAVPVATTNPAIAISGVADLLSRILGSRHQLRSDIAEESRMTAIQANRTEFEVAVMNLAVNARDSMPDGGEVVIEAAAVHIHGLIGCAEDRRFISPSAPGYYVRVSVIDNGVGMTPEVLKRAGDRFFTTKPSGQGTGLGLASVRDFAERLGGKLSIESQVGRGTTASLWLPAVSTSLQPAQTQAA